MERKEVYMLGLAKRGDMCKNGDTFLSLTKY